MIVVLVVEVGVNVTVILADAVALAEIVIEVSGIIDKTVELPGIPAPETP